jgi:ribose transport system ATP-binding protein
VAAKQIVEIARAIHARARIIVMDEPTAPLSQHEVDKLFEVIAALKGQGVSVIYISHRLEEVFRVADRVMVLRDGRNAGSFDVAESNFRTLVRAMVGRDLAEMYPRKASHPGEVVLRVERLTHRGALKSVSFDVRRGEILGVFGLLGSGRNELSRALAGALPVEDGVIEVLGKTYRFRSPKQAKRAGVGLVPVERKLEGLVLSMSIKDNVTLPTLGRFARWGVLDGKREDAHTRRWMKELGIRAPNVRQLVNVLSGGTQQKVVLAKWLEAQTKVLVMDEPTRGVDVGAKAEIYQILERLAEAGMAIVLSSSELPELLSMSDRIMVLHNGAIVGILDRGQANQETLLGMAMGGGTEAGEQTE